MKRWDCSISVNRDVVVEADDEAMARGEALNWFFSEVLHVIDDRDVSVRPIEEGEET